MHQQEEIPTPELPPFRHSATIYALLLEITPDKGNYKIKKEAGKDIRK